MLLDQNTALRAARLLRDLGHDAVHCEEIDAMRTEDIDLIAIALREGRLIATHDFDFHAIIATQELAAPSTILIRQRTPTDVETARIIQEVCLLYEARLLEGCLVTTNTDGTKVRMLPISKA